MLATRLARLSTAGCAGAGSAALQQRCLRQLLLSTCGCHIPAAATSTSFSRRSGGVAVRGMQSAADPTPDQQQQQQQQLQQKQQQQQQQLQQKQQQQQQQQQQMVPDTSVQDTMKLLEAGIGPLSTQPMVPAPEGRVFVISGPSGVGKDAVLKRLQQRRPDLHFVVTATSRPMRPGEVDGVDYFFVTKGQFEEWIASQALLEHALVYGEHKGIPRQQVEAALARRCDVVLRIDVQGAATVRRLLPGVVCVFLVAESEAQLVARLVSRKTEPLDKMVTRVQTARDECKQLHAFDYVVTNREGQLEATVDKLCAIIDAERHRTRGGSGAGSTGRQHSPAAAAEGGGLTA